MRSKIIAVNAGIVTVIAILTYVLLQTSLKEVVANPGERKKEVAQALRAASAQLALDALRTERWLEHSASSESTRNVLSLGTPEARSEAATAEANKVRDAAVSEPMMMQSDAMSVTACFTLRMLYFSTSAYTAFSFGASWM